MTGMAKRPGNGFPPKGPNRKSFSIDPISSPIGPIKTLYVKCLAEAMRSNVTADQRQKLESVRRDLLSFRDPGTIAHILRSHEPLTREARDQIAEIFEGKSDCLKVIAPKRRVGAPAEDNWWPMIVMKIIKKLHPDWQQKAIVAEVCNLTGMGRTQVLHYWKKHRHLSPDN
jgi:hypothetical protein